jgi:hypothetical protein
MDTWIWIGAALVAGALLGAAGAVLLLRFDRRDAQTVERLRKELDGYKQDQPLDEVPPPDPRARDEARLNGDSPDHDSPDHDSPDHETREGGANTAI